MCIPLGGSVEDMLKYDSTARLAYETSVNTSYYVSKNRAMMGMDGLVVYWFDASQQFAEAWFCVSNVSTSDYFDMVEQLSELTEGPLTAHVIDKKGILLQSDAKEELNSVGNDVLAIPSDLHLDTYTSGASSTVKANPIAGLGVSFVGAERLFVFTKEFSKSANFDDTQIFYSEMLIVIGPLSSLCLFLEGIVWEIDPWINCR